MDTLVVVQARYGSSRLPGKALYPLAGRPMLAFLLERLLAGGLAPCLATTRLPQDDALAAWAGWLGVPVVRGEDEDVLARYVRCLDEFSPRVVVRVTGDNPLTCPDLVEAAVQAVRDGADYAPVPSGCPVGLGADAFDAQVLRAVSRECAPGPGREHINLHVLENPGKFSSACLRLACPAKAQDARFTVDTGQEYQWVRAFVEQTCNGDVPLAFSEVARRHAP